MAVSEYREAGGDKVLRADRRGHRLKRAVRQAIQHRRDVVLGVVGLRARAAHAAGVAVARNVGAEFHRGLVGGPGEVHRDRPAQAVAQRVPE